jgi:hypothetical protein
MDQDGQNYNEISQQDIYDQPYHEQPPASQAEQPLSGEEATFRPGKKSVRRKVSLDSFQETDTSYNPEKHVAREKKRKLWIVTWAAEITAMLLSIIFVCAIIYILLRMQNQPATNWSVGLVTLPGAVAGLSTLATLALSFSMASCIDQEKWRYFKGAYRKLQHLSRFDELAKGPVGAFRILFSVWSFTVPLASAIVILSFITHFMVQNVLGTEEVSITTNSTGAFFPYAQSWDPGAYSYWSGGTLAVFSQ